jgi:hypothetical protein
VVDDPDTVIAAILRTYRRLTTGVAASARPSGANAEPEDQLSGRKC